jgi:hypothetical protein
MPSLLTLSDVMGTVITPPSSPRSRRASVSPWSATAPSGSAASSPRSGSAPGRSSSSAGTLTGSRSRASSAPPTSSANAAPRPYPWTAATPPPDPLRFRRVPARVRDRALPVGLTVRCGGRLRLVGRCGPAREQVQRLLRFRVEQPLPPAARAAARGVGVDARSCSARARDRRDAPTPLVQPQRTRERLQDAFRNAARGCRARAACSNRR